MNRLGSITQPMKNFKTVVHVDGRTQILQEQKVLIQMNS